MLRGIVTLLTIIVSDTNLPCRYASSIEELYPAVEQTARLTCTDDFMGIHGKSPNTSAILCRKPLRVLRGNHMVQIRSRRE